MVVVTLVFGAARIVATRMSAKKRRETLRLLEELSKKHAVSRAKLSVAAGKPERKSTLARFLAVIANLQTSSV